MSKPIQINNPCPVCGANTNDCVVSVSGLTDKPSLGDITVCSSCATVLTFNEDLTLKECAMLSFPCWHYFDLSPDKFIMLVMAKIGILKHKEELKQQNKKEKKKETHETQSFAI